MVDPVVLHPEPKGIKVKAEHPLITGIKGVNLNSINLTTFTDRHQPITHRSEPIIKATLYELNQIDEMSTYRNMMIDITEILLLSSGITL